MDNSSESPAIDPASPLTLVESLATSSVVAGLYVVATPIGNLGDITLRAIKILQRAEVIACEDTRNSRPMLAHYGIATSAQSLWAVHEHNERIQAAALAERVASGAVVALITDAGTPGISDPGARVVQYFREQELPVFAIPGPSAIIAALSVAGIAETAFTFIGFLPSSRGERCRALEAIRLTRVATVVYESPHRIKETLVDAVATLGADAQIFIARELTKRFETTGWSRIDDALARLDKDSNQERGEFVLVFPAAAAPESQSLESALPTLKLLLSELPPTKAVKLAAKITGADKDALYAAAIALKGE